MIGNFYTKMAEECFVAFGIVLGAAMLGGIAAILTFQPPTYTMEKIAANIKIWAVVAAVGGTIDPFRVIESNFLDGNISPAVKQILFFVSAFIGAHLGTRLVTWICHGGAEL